MIVLVVYCHPDPESFCAKIRTEFTEALNAVGHEVLNIDLYAENFAPQMETAEFRSYHDLSLNTLQVASHVEYLRKAEGVAFIYPTWWYGMPAMVKGYLDRVWLPGVAFGLDDQGRVRTDALPQVRRFMVITTHGAPWTWIRLGMGDPGRKAVQRGLRRLFSPACRSRWLALYSMDSNGRQEREAFLRRVAKGARLFDD
jgi:NAD(P)H dehydrogenase (quinone)